MPSFETRSVCETWDYVNKTVENVVPRIYNHIAGICRSIVSLAASSVKQPTLTSQPMQGTIVH